jgi:hypothetical protein
VDWHVHFIIGSIIAYYFLGGLAYSCGFAAVRLAAVAEDVRRRGGGAATCVGGGCTNFFCGLFWLLCHIPSDQREEDVVMTGWLALC